MLRRTILAALIVLVSSLCLADSGDDTLRFYLGKSDLVVSGRITTEPFGAVTEAGVVNYIVEFKVDDVAKGNAALKGTTIKVDIVRFEMLDEPKNPLIAKGAECILCLKRQPEGNIPQWSTADFWFGVHAPSPWMMRSLKGLAGEKDK